MKKIFIILFLFISCKIFAQQYNVLFIPDSILKGSDAVVRYYEKKIDILSPGKAKVYEKKVYTILNEEGQYYTDFYTFYDKFNSIKSIDGNLYDAMGKQLKNVKNRDISDHSYFDGISLMGDDRYKEHNFNYRDYPFTVEYEEEDEMNGIFYFPDWSPQRNFYLGVEYSKMIVTVPKNYILHYKEVNNAPKPQVTESSDKIIYTWEVKKLPPRKPEPLQPAKAEILPRVMLAPGDFEIQGYKGNMDNWQSFGVFVNNLRKGRDVLPDGIKQKVHELTDGITDPKEKTKKLYEYLQQNTRYISVQLGIGGWQPFDANYVSNNKYGDCKALSNYMLSLLKEAGIKANYAMIDAGENPRKINDDFPKIQFNHATLCVPIDKDSIWLECTSQNKAFGYAGTGTGNRKAILMDDDGGHVVNTPYYGINENQAKRKITATIDENGNLMMDNITTRSAFEQEDIYGLIHGANADELKKYLSKGFDLPTYKLESYSFDEKKDRIPVITATYKITADKYATISGKRLFIVPNILARSRKQYKTDSARKYPFVLDYSFRHIDTVNITIPAGYIVEAAPKPVTIANKFGKYEIHFSSEGNNIVCTRLFEQYEGTFPPESWNEYVKFYDDMFKADRSKMVFVKKDSQ